MSQDEKEGMTKTPTSNKVFWRTSNTASVFVFF